MSDKSNNLNRLWQELKRRNVTRVLAVYIASAFMILELLDMITEPFGLPDWSFKAALFILIAGLFIAVIISWIYDVHPKEGIVKTQPADTIKPGDKPITSSRWKIATYVSFVVIIGLVVLNVMGRSKQLRAGDIQSILILPFSNYTGADSLDYFVEGMHSALISDIMRIRGLNVINKTSSYVYKNADMRLHEIASELNVDAVIEGDIMCLGDSICSELRLIRGSSEEELLWIEDYTEEISQILNYYKRITKQIADELKIELSADVERYLAKSRTVDREMYDSYLKGFSYMEDMSIEAVYKAMEYLNSAIEKDPDWAPLYAGLAKVWIVIASFGYESHSIAYQNVYDNLDKALELDPNLSDGQYIRAMSAYLNEWNWDKSEKEFLKILAVNPNDVTSRIYYSHLLSILQRFDEALSQGQLALDLDPLNPQIQALYAALYNCVGDCETAKTYYEKVLAVDPQNFLANENMIITSFQCKEYERGWETLKNNLIQKHIIEKDEINKFDEIFNTQGFIAAYKAIVHHLEGLAESGNVDLLKMISPVDMALNYYMINQDDKAIEWLEKGFEMHHPIMPYLFTKIWDFSRLLENPRFIDIARKMNLPMSKD